MIGSDDVFVKVSK